jgi:hypothetical protein
MATSITRGLFAAALLLLVQGCDSVLRVRGTVRDEAGNGLADVTVTLQTTGRAPDRRASAKDGTFTTLIVGAEPDRSRITFRKPGYRTVETPLAGKPQSTVLDVTMAPDSH